MAFQTRDVYTLAAASLTGFASNVTGAGPWTPTTSGPGDGIAHHVTVRNDSATNHSAKTLTLTGTDANGKPLSESMAAPNTSATVTSTKAFKTLTSVAVSSTIGADTFDIGWAATGHTPWIALDMNIVPQGASMQVGISGTANVDVQQTVDSALNEDSPASNHASATGATATTLVALSIPCTGVRVDVNSHTSGVLTVIATQWGARNLAISA